MFLTILVIFGLLLEVIIIGLGLYLVSKFTKPVKLKTAKVKSVEIPRPIVRYVEVPQTIKRNVTPPASAIYTSDVFTETPIKKHGTDLIPYGLSDMDKEI